MVSILIKNDGFVCKSTGSEKSFAVEFHEGPINLSKVVGMVSW